METLGIEATRKRLPELVAAAREGKTTLITRRGKACAAIVPASIAQVEGFSPLAMLQLRGSARGVWSRHRERDIATLRDEWER